MASEVEIFQNPRQLSRFSDILTTNKLAPTTRQLYIQLLQQALQEFPPIEGYETMHMMLMERTAFTFCKMKEAEVNPVDQTYTKDYYMTFSAFGKMVEKLLKEAKNISLETTFKHNFVIQVIEVVDRVVQDSETKIALSRELHKLAAA
jgi:hypothetical protein